MRLTYKFALGIVLLVGLPVFLLSQILTRTSLQTIENQAAEHLVSVNHLKQSEFNRWLKDNAQRLTLLAQRPLVRDGLTYLVKDHYLAPSTPESLEAHEAEHARMLNDHLLPYISEGGFERVLILDPRSGEVLLSTDRFVEGTNVQSEKYFLQGRIQTTIQNPYYSAEHSKVLMTIATPVSSRTGELVAVLAGNLDLDEMTSILSHNWDRTDSEETYIVNASSRLVTTPRFGDETQILQKVETQGVQQALAGESGYATYLDYRGTLVLGAYLWMQERQLAILTEMDLEEAIGPIARVRTTIIWGSALIGLAAIALGMMLSLGLTKPVERLVSATRLLGAGHLDHRIAVTSHDEIGTLGHAFNSMAENLKQTTTSIEALHREAEARTAAELQLNRTIEALEQSEAMFRLLTDASPIGIVIIEGSKLRYTNPSFEKAFGYRRDELIHQLGPLDIAHVSDHERVRDYMIKSMAGIEGLSPCPFVGIRKDGSHIHCEAMARPIEHKGSPALLGTIVDVTVRRKAERELRLKNTVFESSIAANFTADVHGRLTHANPSFIKNWGYASEADIIGLPVSRLFLDPSEASAMIHTLKTAGEWEGDFHAIRKDSSTFISNGHATVLRDETDTLIGYQAANLDVTEQRQAQVELHRAKAVTDSIIESIPGLFYQIDRNEHFVRWNNVFEKATGYSHEEISRLHPVDLFKGADREAIAQAMRRVFTHGRAEVVASLVPKWQESIPHLFTGVLKTIDHVPYLLGVGTNITPLLEAEEKFKTLVETTSECLWEVNAKFLYSYVSPRIRDLLGYEPDELIGKSPFELMTPTAQSQLRDELRVPFRDRIPFSGVENENIAKDGHSVILETSGRPILGSKGELLGYRGINRDVTERKNAEQQLSQLLGELQRSNRDLEQFAYIASHDLQEPLRMVASYTQLLEKRYKDQLDASAREFIAFAVDGANRMQRLINDLLTFSRIQTKGKSFERVDLNRVLEQATTNLQATIQEANATLESDKLPVVLADEGQMVSVFQNLIANGIKFRSNDPPRIVIRVQDQGNEWEIAVSDNGIGVPPEFRDRIFVIFQRLHTRDEYPGTGIGLALCKRIIERHGGRIWVTSAEKTGSTFRFIMAKDPEEAP